MLSSALRAWGTNCRRGRQPSAHQSAASRVADNGLVGCSSRNVRGRKPCESLHGSSCASSTLAPAAASLSALSPWCLFGVQRAPGPLPASSSLAGTLKPKIHPANTAL